VVAEWSVVPLYPAGFFQWYERLRDLTGLQRPNTLADAECGYARLDCQRAELLYRRFGARYFALEKGRVLPCGTVVYRDTTYQVVDYAH
jgi:hypothetical protein